ncbi:MAG: hypothetical protein IPM92_13575 [Saprospiraceae bacterium]|nr:hypothetical protein [Saprospiraceae bacterium]
MIKTKTYQVFAFPVEDLSIARYLAAREADYIGIPIDAENLQKSQTLIFQLREWLAGPKLIGILNTAFNVSGLEALDGYYHTEQLVFYLGQAELNPLNSGETPFLENKYFHILDKQGHSMEVQNAFLEMDLSDAPTRNNKYIGFVIHPGFERQTGICDFDLLDQWFDKLDAIQFA